ncbi:hypothetical protein QVD17_16924 [Tagetes erecta]|uniref:Uncharacterized protein n=1 Tax=Tagetes erecta TaxID=13708 RepID=A0AAD8KVQ9_TARER|nr:hypothetical protein QVD17_16924 [Tagetes erecta]
MELLSAGSTKPEKTILDDLLLSNEVGKNDYDWLLTPPDTTLLRSSNTRELQPKSAVPRRNSSVRSARSSSVTRTSISTTSNNRPPSATRPPTPSSRSRTIRSSTPTPCPQSTMTRSASRPSTPTRSNRSVGPASRPNSPVSRVLRTCVPERPVSTGRSRSGAAMTVKENVENMNTRKQSPFIVARGTLAGPPRTGRSHANGHAVESVTRKPIKVLNSDSGTTKKSLDMPIKHKDIRTGGTRPLSRSTLFPQSIRSSPGSASNNVNSKNGTFENSFCSENRMKPVTGEHKSPYSSKLSKVDVYESLRYDTILLKEDLKNTSWLHSADEKSDQSPLFDNVFEPLPEPFAPL